MTQQEKEIKETTLGELSYNGTQVVRRGESTIPAFEKTCLKCGTKFLYISEAIKHDRDGDYVVCPCCGAFIAHQERPKTADFISPKCTSDAKCEDRSPKHSDSFTSLEEAAEKHLDTVFGKGKHQPFYKELFIAGAEWQKEQMGEQARKELAKTDITLADLVAFDEGLQLGRRLERQDMLKDAVEGYVNYYEDGGGKLMAEAQVGCPYHLGDKVKIVIIPEKEEEK